MPAGKNRMQKSHQHPLTTIYELSGRRKESGSQYTLLVAKIPDPPAGMAVEDMIREMKLLILDQQPIRRNGVDGIAGRWTHESMAAEASEAEVFFHNGHLVALMYSPYSKIQFAIGGTQSPRENERELDRPLEFFTSVRFE